MTATVDRPPPKEGRPPHHQGPTDVAVTTPPHTNATHSSSGRDECLEVLAGIAARRRDRVAAASRVSTRSTARRVVGRLEVDRVAWAQRGARDALRRVWQNCCTDCRPGVAALAADYAVEAGEQ